MQRRTLITHGLKATLAAAALPVATPWLGGLAQAQSGRPAKVAVLIPQSGPAALFGPSSKNCAELAVAEINGRGGLAGRPVQLVLGDAGQPPAEVTQAALRLWRGERCEAFVGMHDSAVRGALVGLFKGQVPYVYTPVYEGGECAKGTYVLGETPQQQLQPVIPWLARERSLKRWYLIGNDYNWPRDTNAQAKRFIAASGGEVVGEEYLPFTVDNFDANLARIRQTNADAVLITLVGGASVGFSRAFASFGLAERVVRLGTLIEENTVAGIGAQNTRNLYASGGYFASIDTAPALAFAHRYRTRFGADAPVLNALAQSCFDGLMLLEAMANKARSLEVGRLEAVAEGLSYSGPRGEATLRARHTTKDIYLAQADGAALKVVQTFPAVDAGQTCKV
jgi:urea transport system substrate-binding protein